MAVLVIVQVFGELGLDCTATYEPALMFVCNCVKESCQDYHLSSIYIIKLCYLATTHNRVDISILLFVPVCIYTPSTFCSKDVITIL